jgi:hypothetical protein
MGGGSDHRNYGKTQQNWSKNFFLQIHEKWSFCDFYNRIVYFLPPMLLLVGVALALTLADGYAIQERTRLQKNFHKNPCTKIPYTKIRYKNHLRRIHLDQLPVCEILYWKYWMKFISRIYSVCGPALEILNEVQKSNPLLMWPCTRHIGWSSSVDPTPYVVLHWTSWMKFISPIHFWCGPALEILDEVHQSIPLIM